MIRLTRKVFTDLAFWMIGFGVLIGVVFPFFVSLMGVPSALVLTPWFFVICISAGILVGAVNIGLARLVIGSRLGVLSRSMRSVEANLRVLGQSVDSDWQRPEACFVDVDSDDEIGESAQAFNNLVEALLISHEEAASQANKVRSMIEGMGGGIIVTKANGSVSEVNQWLLEKTGADRNAVVGKKLWDLQPKTERPFGLQGLLKEYQDGTRRDSCAIDAKVLGLRAKLQVQPVFEEGTYRGLIINLIDSTGMAEMKGKLITLVFELMKLKPEARETAIEAIKRMTGKDYRELEPEGWYDSRVLGAMLKCIEDREERAVLAWAAIKLVGVEMFPKMKAAGSLPDQLHTPEEFLRFEAEQFLDNYRGDGAMPRKFIKVDPGHIVIEAASPGYHCSFTEGVYSGILRLCDITNGRVRQTKCVLDGDANCEYDIRW